MPVQHGEARDMVPSPARGHGDRWERWGRKPSPRDHRNDPHPGREHRRPRTGPPGFPFRLCHRAVLPRVRRDLRARPALRLCRLLRPPRGPLPVPAADQGRHPGRAAEHVALRAAPAGAPRYRGPADDRARLHPPDPRRQPRQDPGPAPAVDQGRPGEPDALVQGPRGCGGPGRRHRARLHRAGLPVNGQPGQRRRGRGRAGRAPLGGARPRRPGTAEDHHHLGPR